MRKSMWLGHTCVSIYGHKYEISLKIVIHGDGKSSKTNDLERYSAVMFCAFCPQPRLLSSYGLPFFCFHLLLLYYIYLQVLTTHIYLSTLKSISQLTS